MDPASTTPPTIVVLSTCPDSNSARQISEALVEQRLAACVNQLPGLDSVYRWQGKIQHDNEVLLLIKTVQCRYPAIEQLVHQLHPYETPELVALPIQDGLSDYIKWIQQCST